MMSALTVRLPRLPWQNNALATGFCARQYQAKSCSPSGVSIQCSSHAPAGMPYAVGSQPCSGVGEGLKICVRRYRRRPIAAARSRLPPTARGSASVGRLATAESRARRLPCHPERSEGPGWAGHGTCDLRLPPRSLATLGMTRSNYATVHIVFVESRLRVRYKETDQMGIAHHANYIVWFEIGRTDLCRAVGFPYRDIEARGYILVVTETQCRYRVPYRYDDEVVIRTS